MISSVLKIVFLLFCSFSIAQTLDQCNTMISAGIANLKTKDHIASLQYLTKAKTIAKKNHWHKQYFLAVNNIGINYYMMLDYGEALNSFLEAYTIASKHLDTKNEMSILNNIAILYSKEENWNKSEEYFLKAYNLAVSRNDSMRIGIYSVNLAGVANEKGEPKKEKEYIDIAYSHLKKGTSDFYHAEIALAKYYILVGNCKSAKNLLLSLLPKLSSAEYSEQRILAYISLSNLYDNEDLPSAIKYARQAANDKNATIESKAKVYEKLSLFYRKANMTDSAFLFKDSVIWANNTFNRIKNGKLFENSKIKFELQNYKHELEKREKQLQLERRQFYILLGGIFMLGLIGFWSYTNYFKQLKQRKIIAENNQKIAELKFEKEKKDKLILEKEIELKSRQLTSKTIYLLTRKELIQDIIDSLFQSSEVSVNASMKQKIAELKSHLKDESHWDDFFVHFEEVNKNFLRKLKEKHPELSSNDIRFLSYIYMNLSTKEISTLLNITIDACRKRKERIIKKVDLPAKTDLYQYISEF